LWFHLVGTARRLVPEVVIWRRKSVAAEPTPPSAQYRAEDIGLVLLAGTDCTRRSAAASALVEQFCDEGIASGVEGGHLVAWDCLYTLLEDPEREAEMEVLGLPEQIEASPRLVSRGSLTDTTFSVAVDGWLDGDRRTIHGAQLRAGALEVDGVTYLLPPVVWRLVDRVRGFARRPLEDRGETAQRGAWGAIRREAVAAGAMLDDFLYRTVVLTPDRLQLSLRREESLGLVEVQPWFEGAPSHWLNAFDAASKVRDRYDLVTPEGVVQVIITPEVSTVLREIKRMPGRRIAGERAQAFLVNPVAALGPDAADALDTAQFEQAKEEAGISLDRFAAIVPETHGEGALGLLVVSGLGEQIETRQVMLDDVDVREFVDRVEGHMARGLQLCAWDDYEFELDGDSALHCAALRRAVDRQAASLISHGQVYDLSGYSDRVEGIGQETRGGFPKTSCRSSAGTILARASLRPFP
jgi:hypothetical protein